MNLIKYQGALKGARSRFCMGDIFLCEAHPGKTLQASSHHVFELCIFAIAFVCGSFKECGHNRPMAFSGAFKPL